MTGRQSQRSRGDRRSVISVRAVALTATVLVAIVAAACSSQTAAPPSSHWSSAVSIDPPQGNLVAITCTGGSDCTALDNVGNVLKYDSTGWHGPIEAASGADHEPSLR